MKNIYESANSLEMKISADYDGPNSGDHGGIITLEMHNSTGMRATILEDGYGFRITVVGCTEFETFTKAINDANHYLVSCLLNYWQNGGD